MAAARRRASTSPGLASWPGEFLGGRTFPLPGSSGDGTGIASGLSAGSTGEARVVITRIRTTTSPGTQALPASYRTGQLPTGKQLFGGPVPIQENWNVVVASVYEYIELKYGMNQMLGSAVLLYTNDTMPFGNILAASSKGTFSFYNQAAIRSSWQTWLASL